MFQKDAVELADKRRVVRKFGPVRKANNLHIGADRRMDTAAVGQGQILNDSVVFHGCPFADNE